MLNKIRKIEKRALKELSIEHKRYLFSKIDFNLHLIGIVGSRGVGKTTFLLQYVSKLKKIYDPYKSLYISYDYVTSIDINLLYLAKELSKVGGEFLIIDAINNCPNYEKELKDINIFFPNLKVIFSTTNQSFSDELDNLAVIYQLNGLSYREFLELKFNIELPSFKLEDILENSVYIVNKLEDSFTPLEHFNEYLLSGYYPMYFKDNGEYISELNSNLNMIIDIDLLQLGHVKQSFTCKLKKLLLIISESNPSGLNITKVSNDLGVSRNTIYAYLKSLKLGGLISIVHGKKKGISKLAKPEKLYLDNTNLFYCLVDEMNIETIRETFFVSQLRQNYTLNVSREGDFIVDEKSIFKVSMKDRDFKETHVEDADNFYLVIDTDSTEDKFKIPLWLFGFLY